MPGQQSPSRHVPAVSFFAFLFLTLAWQAFYCVAATRADPAGLFFHGDAFKLPPDLRGSFQYPHSAGYDGQAYRVLAHDPLNRKGDWSYLDDSRFRSRRILIPALAALAGEGSPRAVDLAYIAITDIFLALGAVCFLRLAPGVRPVTAVAIYALIPAVVASTDRMVLDGPAVALFLAVLLCFRERRWGACLGLAAVLPLVRETGMMVTAGLGLAFLMRREYRRVVWAAATAAPALAWWWFSARITPSSSPLQLLSFPLWPQILRLFQPFPRPVPLPVKLLLGSLDLLGCLCLLAAFFWFGRIVWLEFREGGWKEDTLIVLPSVMLATVASSRSIMEDPYAFLRVDSVLLAWVYLRLVRRQPQYAVAYSLAASAALTIFRAGPFLRLMGR